MLICFSTWREDALNISDAARIVGISPAQARRWTKKRSAGFADVVDLYVLNALVSQTKLGVGAVRELVREAAERLQLDDEHPLTLERFHIGARKLWLEPLEPDAPPTELGTSGQTTHRVIVRHQVKNSEAALALEEAAGAITFVEGHATRIEVAGSGGRLVLADGIHGGQEVVVRDRRVSAWVLCEAYEREQDFEKAAWWYEVDPDDVRAAVKICRRRAA